jgi:hypothetical protein
MHPWRDIPHEIERVAIDLMAFLYTINSHLLFLAWHLGEIAALD